MDDRSTTVSVGGSLSGVVVIGDHNVVCDHSGTTVSPTTPPAVRRTTPPRSLLWGQREAPVGRDAELRAVHAELDARRHVQLHGPAGYGKSLLLRHVSRQRAARDHVICLTASGKHVDDLLQDLFEACYEGAEDYRPTPARLRRFLEPVRAVLVLDHLSDQPEDIERVLDAASGCTVLSAARERTLWSAGRAVAVGDLSPEASLALVHRVLGRPPTPAELRQVQAARGSPPALLRIATTTTDDRHRRVIRVLALLGGVGCSVALLALLAGIASAEAAPVVADLERVGFVTADGGGVHLATPAAEVASASSAATTLTDWLWTGPARPEVVEAAPVIVAVLTAAGPTAEALALARVAAPALLRSLRLGAWGEVLVLGAKAARLLGESRELAYFERELRVRDRLLAQRSASGLWWKVLLPLLVLAPLVGFGWLALSEPRDTAGQLAVSTTASAPGTVTTLPAGTPTSGPADPGDPTTDPDGPVSDVTTDPPCDPVLPASLGFDVVRDTRSIPIVAQPCHGAGVPTGRLALGGPDASVFTLKPDCPDLLSPGESCTVTIYFDATAPGDYTAQVALPAERPMVLSGVVEATKSPVPPTTTTTTTIPTPG
ncbi:MULTISPECIES: AAA family ATPase [Saccharothrix]|uniref:AAA family ATPase n=1 Tax=Saccharothrix TaxID=2071 RepID=UPI00093AEAC8|nr:AAA family ATPase [Saccharothrix sp. CB00851]OKI29892.1 hypothetical protein A6A25_29710 [Saccharothrix sp. CB00851]